MSKKGRPVIVQEGAPEWIVTFADLMSLLVCFFVLIISFSIQDKEKLQVVAGSMRDAFGVKKTTIKAGMIEIEGAPVRDYVKQVSQLERENDTDFADIPHDQNTRQGPEANTHQFAEADINRPREFALAAASLRQAWQELPEITELSTNIIVQETPEGLHVQLIDQDGRAMFPPGTADPYPHMRNILKKMAPVLRRMPNRIVITGHSRRNQAVPGRRLFALGADRRPLQRRTAGAGRTRRAGRSVLRGDRQGRHRTPVSRRRVSRRQPAHQHPGDERGASPAPGPPGLRHRQAESLVQVAAGLGSTRKVEPSTPVIRTHSPASTSLPLISHNVSSSFSWPRPLTIGLSRT